MMRNSSLNIVVESVDRSFPRPSELNNFLITRLMKNVNLQTFSIMTLAFYYMEMECTVRKL